MIPKLALNNCGSGATIVLVIAIISTSLVSMPTTSASSSCDVPASSDWGSDFSPKDYMEVSRVNEGDLFGDSGLQSSLYPLDKGFSTEWSDGTWGSFPGVAVLNDSATTLSMVLEPGHLYTFCIEFGSSSSSASSEARGDIYLMTEQNYGMYVCSNTNQENGQMNSGLTGSQLSIGTSVPGLLSEIRTRMSRSPTGSSQLPLTRQGRLGRHLGSKSLRIRFST